jgi:hypothetical protein
LINIGDACIAGLHALMICMLAPSFTCPAATEQATSSFENGTSTTFADPPTTTATSTEAPKPADLDATRFRLDASVDVSQCISKP